MTRRLKRPIDVVVATAALAVLAPCIGLIALMIRSAMGTPVLFRQMRPGLFGEPFTLLKFRTMRDAVGPDGEPLSDRERTTRLGRLLRRTSLDELPELWNIVLGDMSLVGPRPLLMEYLDLYSRDQKRRHDVLPGLTGLAQVNGRRTVQMQERLALDVWYVDNWSFGMDLQILLSTVRMVLAGHGAVAAEEIATADLGWTPDRPPLASDDQVEDRPASLASASG